MVMESTTHEHIRPNPATWVDAYGDYLFRYALSRLRNHESAEEVVQETFVAALKSLNQFAGRGAERAWLLGILKRKIVDFVRRRAKSTSLDSNDRDEQFVASIFDASGKWRDDPRICQSNPSEDLERAEFMQALHACLKGLPPRQGDVFMLREMEELDSEEICKEMGITASNLWVLLYRARLGLANCLKSRYQPEGAA